MKIADVFKQKTVASPAQRAFFGLLVGANVLILFGLLWHMFATRQAFGSREILTFAVFFPASLFVLGYLTVTGWLPGSRR
jgi:hypothetical protein